MNRYPIIMFPERIRFRSRSAVARHLGVWQNSIADAVERGTCVKGHRFRYADMPEACQPFRKDRKRIAVFIDGEQRESIWKASGGDRAKYMRIWRRVKRQERKP